MIASKSGVCVTIGCFDDALPLLGAGWSTAGLLTSHAAVTAKADSNPKRPKAKRSIDNLLSRVCEFLERLRRIRRFVYRRAELRSSHPLEIVANGPSSIQPAHLSA